MTTNALVSSSQLLHVLQYISELQYLGLLDGSISGDPSLESRLHNTGSFLKYKMAAFHAAKWEGIRRRWYLFKYKDIWCFGMQKNSNNGRKKVWSCGYCVLKSKAKQNYNRKCLFKNRNKKNPLILKTRKFSHVLNLLKNVPWSGVT